ncbi:hypothetical protein KFL_000830120 [Klebsormidium nitens]|uniref:Translin family protein n=1 Tax=Klebsormidium nitens TaxID=105231 RepID=A0A1Y1HSC2_KLENI|nr:hypothetical protein KFL_000830120 [Klebsormidium nitens]|eukprot:GAQ81530.1 hypothetical protein KFL_000830120 [Klebsormidium nitens]
MSSEASSAVGGIGDAFRAYAKQLDAVNERRERLVKASRDVTIASKKVIFAVHRLPADGAGGGAEEAALGQAEKDLQLIRKTSIKRVAQELQDEDYWRFSRAFSPGMQEYVEATAVLHYAKTGRLLTYAEANAELSEVQDAGGQAFRLSAADYLLGITDLTGEVMRLAISSVAAGNKGAAASMAAFVGAVYEGFHVVPMVAELRRDLAKKLEVMRSSLVKIETASYMVHVRGSEYPEQFLAERLAEAPEDRLDPDM